MEMTDREMLCRVRLYTDDSKSNKMEMNVQREEMSKKKKWSGQRLNVVLKCLALTSIFFIGTCVGARWYDLLWSHVMNLAILVMLIMSRKEMTEWKRRNTSY